MKKTHKKTIKTVKRYRVVIDNKEECDDFVKKSTALKFVKDRIKSIWHCYGNFKSDEECFKDFFEYGYLRDKVSIEPYYKVVFE